MNKFSSLSNKELTDAKRLYSNLIAVASKIAKEVLDNQPVQHPRQMGIDEFSVAKRHKYRTVLTDLEKHCVVTTIMH